MIHLKRENDRRDRGERDEVIGCGDCLEDITKAAKNGDISLSRLHGQTRVTGGVGSGTRYSILYHGPEISQMG